MAVQYVYGVIATHQTFHALSEICYLVLNFVLSYMLRLVCAIFQKVTLKSQEKAVQTYYG